MSKETTTYMSKDGPTKETNRMYVRREAKQAATVKYFKAAYEIRCFYKQLNKLQRLVIFFLFEELVCVNKRSKDSPVGYSTSNTFPAEIKCSVSYSVSNACVRTA